MDARTEGVELRRIVHVIAEAQAYHFRRVGNGAATDCQERVGVGLAGGVGSGYHVDARRVGADLRADAGQLVAE